MHQVGDTRRIGTIGALELQADDPGYLSALRPKLYDFFLRRGVLLRPSHGFCAMDPSSTSDFRVVHSGALLH